MPTRANVLRQLGLSGNTVNEPRLTPSAISSGSEGLNGPVVSAVQDFEEKRRAMQRICVRPFVTDAKQVHFTVAQNWIEECGRQVDLPLNFCGGLLIIRLCRLIASPLEQSPEWMDAVREAAAAYDFAFLALGHADDEADLTRVRDGKPTRYVTHTDTRAVDGINLLLSGVTAMQEIINRWPTSAIRGADVRETSRHPLAVEIVEELISALREASFPILLDRAGMSHTSKAVASRGLTPIQVDSESLHRVEAFARHRAHTYFLRATRLATLLAGYSSIEPSLLEALSNIFRLWGFLGAATDDLQDIVDDFSAGIHSVCTVMAHLCVEQDPSLRPAFRRDLAEQLVRDQQERLARFFGTSEAVLDLAALLKLLDDIELRKALAHHFEGQGAQLAAAIYYTVNRYGFDPNLLVEIVSVVCRDPNFNLPDIYLTAIATVKDEMILKLINDQAGKFMTNYFLERFWPKAQI